MADPLAVTILIQARRGFFCSSTPIYRDELHDLIAFVRNLVDRNEDAGEYTTYDGTIAMKATVDQTHPGPPVHVQFSSLYTLQPEEFERYEVSMITNLSYLRLFVEVLEKW